MDDGPGPSSAYQPPLTTPDASARSELQEDDNSKSDLPVDSPNSGPPVVVEEEERSLKYGAEHVIRVFAPVSVCMAFVIFTMNTIGYYSRNDGIYLIYTPFTRKTDNAAEQLAMSVGNALTILGVVIVMTGLLIFLYYFRFYKVIHGWLILSSTVLLSVFSTIYVNEVFKHYNVPIDYITFIFGLWNFGVVGMICIHWKGPLLLQQMYLVTISAFMALMFIKYLPDWTVWTVLAMLSLWDLVAVLCPRGPLRILVETAQKRNEPIFPALIYSSGMVYTFVVYAVNAVAGEGEEDGGAVEEPNVEQAPNTNQLLSPARRSIPRSSIEVSPSSPEYELLTGAKPIGPIRRRVPPARRFSEGSDEPIGRPMMRYGYLDDPKVQTNTRRVVFDPAVKQVEVIAPRRPSPAVQVSQPQRRGNSHQPYQRVRLNPPPGEGGGHHGPSQPQIQQQQRAQQPKKRFVEDSGIKLGLGDFIFYSVLVGKASSYGDWNTTIACYVSILIGLAFTLMLLAVFRKALPALPISIFAGLIFYFSTRLLITPFMSQLTIRQICV